MSRGLQSIVFDVADGLSCYLACNRIPEIQSPPGFAQRLQVLGSTRRADLSAQFSMTLFHGPASLETVPIR